MNRRVVQEERESSLPQRRVEDDGNWHSNNREKIVTRTHKIKEISAKNFHFS